VSKAVATRREVAQVSVTKREVAPKKEVTIVSPREQEIDSVKRQNSKKI
jgi:hypothetical protein